MKKGIGRLFSPSQEWWIWIAGLICVVLLILFYKPPATSSETVTRLATAQLTATPESGIPAAAAPTATVTRPPKKSPTPAATATPTLTPAPRYHTVQAGDIPGAIAAEYGISLESLLELNGIADPTNLQIGQKLLIPGSGTTAAPPTRESTVIAARVTPTPMATLVFYTVEQGDTLLDIAIAHETTVEAIVTANRLANPHSLQIGQRLAVPPDDGAAPDPTDWAPTTIHRINAGDTLLELARDYGSTVEDILALNPGLDPTGMQIGQQVTVPIIRQMADATDEGIAVDLPEAFRLSEEELAELRNTSPDLVDMEQEMIDIINTERRARELAPVKIDPDLTLMAWERARDMAARDYVSHDTPEGQTLRDRFEARGWPTDWIGENIYLSTLPADQAVEQTMAWFMQDEAHRQNILSPRLNRIGVGVAHTPAGWYTFVQVFARK